MTNKEEKMEKKILRKDIDKILKDIGDEYQELRTNKPIQPVFHFHVLYAVKLHKKICEYISKAIDKAVEEEGERIVDYLKGHFETALQDGYELGKEAWSDDEPRVRVKWYLDVFIPRLRKGKFW